MPSYYCCTKENNECEKRNDCARYLLNAISTTLFKGACCEDNNFQLFIQAQKITNHTNEKGDANGKAE